MIVLYGSAVCGAGKTREIVRCACKLANDNKRVVIVQPTKELISRTVEGEVKRRTRPPDYKIFTGDTVRSGCSVAREITQYLNDAEDAGQIIFVTHQVFPYIPYFANKGDWHLLIDEEMQVLRYRCHRVPKTHSIITDDIELQPYNATYSQVVPRHRSSLERKGRNKEEDEILARFSDTIRVLTNRNWETFVNTEQYHRLLAGDIATLAFHSVLTPKIFDGFGSVFMAGANFEDTAIFQLWSGPHVFERDDEFANGLRFREHQNGSLITIYYGIDSGWSKKTADRVAADDDSRNIRERLIDGTKELFRGEQFLW
jgi:hypothetical protein